MSMLSIVIKCRLNFENPFISSRVIQENVVLAATKEKEKEQYTLNLNIFAIALIKIRC